MGDEPQIEEKPSEDSESDLSGVASVNNMPDFLKSAAELEAEEEDRKRREEEKLQEKQLQEKKRLEKERLQKENLEKEKREKERLEKEKLEKENLEKEKLQKERLEKEKKEALEKQRLIDEAIAAKKKELEFPSHIDPFINIPVVLTPTEKIDLTYLTSKANAIQEQASNQPLIKFNQNNNFVAPMISNSGSQERMEDSRPQSDLEVNSDDAQKPYNEAPNVPPPTPVCSDPFEEITYPIFNMADVYHDGLLDYREFALVKI